MRNTGQLVANDANRERTKALVANVHRLGLTNTVITCLNGINIPSVSWVLDLLNDDTTNLLSAR
jgi:ribosomal RNA methyltransferase Nop2